MISKELLRQVVQTQKAELHLERETIRRDIADEILKWMGDSRVIILTGIRRCGKSTLLKQLMAQTKQWSYANFEDERLLALQAEDFEMLNEALVDAYGHTKTYFFDEIQNISKFETFVRRLQDEGKKVIITGSNASLLSKEFGTRLTGRYKSFEVHPFSFSEFLKLKKFAFGKNDWYSINKKVQLLKLFEEYSAAGGMPEYAKNKDTDYLRTVFENILYRDILARYAVRRERILKELVNILATNVASQITYNSLKNTLHVANAITVKEYLSYLNNSFLFFELMKFSYSIKKQLAFPRKVYLIDSAFHHVCGMSIAPNKGRIFENMVYLELRRRGGDLYYFSNNNECDFIVRRETKITHAIQVCYAIDDSNRERETTGLVEAMKAFKLREGVILTFEQSGELMVDGKKIHIIPFPKWAVEGERELA